MTSEEIGKFIIGSVSNMDALSGRKFRAILNLDGVTHNHRWPLESYVTYEFPKGYIYLAIQKYLPAKNKWVNTIIESRILTPFIDKNYTETLENREACRKTIMMGILSILVNYGIGLSKGLEELEFEKGN